MKSRKDPSEKSACSLLAFGAHPDDVELTVGGTLHKLSKAGHPVVIIDLTRGESSTRGTVERRRREAARAAAILGVTARENLEMPDAGLEPSLTNRRSAAAAIRKHRPAIVLAPWIEDDHPDHAAAGRIVEAAFFEARLASLAGPEGPWFASILLFYPCRRYLHPSLVVDVGAEYPVKKKAFRTHRSQIVGPREKSFRPPGAVDPFTLAETRDRHFGSLIGTTHGEGFFSPTPLPLHSLDVFLKNP